MKMRTSTLAEENVMILLSLTKHFYCLLTTVVNAALYVIHSVDVPAIQDPVQNLCWRITNGKLELTRSCQVLLNSLLPYTIQFVFNNLKL